MIHPDGKFEYCNTMLHVILKLSYEFARWQMCVTLLTRHQSA